MGKLLRLPVIAIDRGNGLVHVLPDNGIGYGVSHESSSGNSWGGVEYFDDPQEAVAAAYRVARNEYAGCDVAIAPSVMNALPATPGPTKGGF